MSHRGLFVCSLSLIFVVALCACAKKQALDTTTTPEVETTTAPPAPETEVTESMTDTDQLETREVKLPVLEDVFFAFDRSDLSAEAKRKLENNARQLKDASQATITIEGHCDERGTVAYNLALGERRAKAAKDYLRSLGVSEGRMKTVSYGEERPFDTGHTEAAWAKNRRAHFVVKQN